MTAGASRPADPQRRLHAFLTDQACVLAAAATGTLAAGLIGGLSGAAAGVSGLVVGLSALAALGAVAGTTGTSPGRTLHRLRLVDEVSGQPVGAGRGALRAVACGAGGWVTLGTGWLLLGLSMARDSSGQGRGWHDRLAGTRVDAAPAPTAVSRRGAEFEDRTRVAAAGDVVDLTVLRQHPGAAPDLPARRAVPAPRAAEPRVLPGRWQVEVDGGSVHDVVDRLRWQGIELARMPDGALVLRDLGTSTATLLVRGGAARTVAPGQVSTLLPGDRVRVGQHWMRVAGQG